MLIDPQLRKLEGITITSGAWTLPPDQWAGGQFAYAFSRPPYSLDARPNEVQAVFEAIRDFILPPLEEVEIRDWSSPQLPEVSGYFDAGREWWGVFLFSVHVPAMGRMTIIAGSTSD